MPLNFVIQFRPQRGQMSSFNKNQVIDEEVINMVVEYDATPSQKEAPKEEFYSETTSVELKNFSHPDGINFSVETNNPFYFEEDQPKVFQVGDKDAGSVYIASKSEFERQFLGFEDPTETCLILLVQGKGEESDAVSANDTENLFEHPIYCSSNDEPLLSIENCEKANKVYHLEVPIEQLNATNSGDKSPVFAEKCEETALIDLGEVCSEYQNGNISDDKSTPPLTVIECEETSMVYPFYVPSKLLNHGSYHGMTAGLDMSLLSSIKCEEMGKLNNLEVPVELLNAVSCDDESHLSLIKCEETSFVNHREDYFKYQNDNNCSDKSSLLVEKCGEISTAYPLEIPLEHSNDRNCDDVSLFSVINSEQSSKYFENEFSLEDGSFDCAMSPGDADHQLNNNNCSSESFCREEQQQSVSYHSGIELADRCELLGDPSPRNLSKHSATVKQHSVCCWKQSRTFSCCFQQVKSQEETKNDGIKNDCEKTNKANHSEIFPEHLNTMDFDDKSHPSVKKCEGSNTANPPEVRFEHLNDSSCDDMLHLSEIKCERTTNVSRLATPLDYLYDDNRNDQSLPLPVISCEGSSKFYENDFSSVDGVLYFPSSPADTDPQFDNNTCFDEYFGTERHHLSEVHYNCMDRVDYCDLLGDQSLKSSSIDSSGWEQLFAPCNAKSSTHNSYSQKLRSEAEIESDEKKKKRRKGAKAVLGKSLEADSIVGKPWQKIENNVEKNKSEKLVECGPGKFLKADGNSEWKRPVKEEWYFCSICSAWFKDLQTHLKTHQNHVFTNSSDVQLSQTTNFRNVLGMRSLLATSSNEKPFTCSNCLTKLESNESLKRHFLYYHSTNYSFLCSHCSKTFKTYQSLKNHSLIHRNGKLISCPYCGKLLKYKSLLNAHLRTHSNERPYSCPSCFARFKSSGYLKRHLLTHSNEKPIACEYCEYRCKTNGALKKHLLTHSTEKPFFCSYCPANFQTNKALKEHLNVHLDEKSFSCFYCFAIFKKMQSLKRHQLIHTDKMPVLYPHQRVTKSSNETG